MHDATDVIWTAAEGHVEELAKRREIRPRRMYEILGKDNPYPKAKRLIREIGAVNPQGARLIKADMDALFTDVLSETRLPDVSTQKLHKEAFEAIDALLAGKSPADCLKELRELDAVVQLKIEGIEKLARGPQRVA